MKKILLLTALLPISLLASKILSYNIYDRTDRADIMITFDTPYSGKITQSTTSNKIIINLEDASIESPKIKKVNSSFLQSLAITPMAQKTQIVASVPQNIRLMASKTSDGYGLRLRFKSGVANSAATTQKEQASTSQNFLSGLPTKKDEGISNRYYIVVGFLLIAVIVLLYFKRQIIKKQSANGQNPWLFQNTPQQASTPMQNATPQQTATLNEVSIRFQKGIDSSNSVVMLDFGSQSYLVLMGNSNILLDKFTDNIPTTQAEFETILQSRHEQLEEFLGTATSTTQKSQKEPLQAYKERAASLLYSDEA